MGLQNLEAQFRSIEDGVRQRISSVLEHGQYIMGPEVFELEEALADYVGVKHCVTCANGTDALVLALMALGVGPGDSVICPTFSFFASAEAPASLGAEVIFVDSDWETFNLSPDSLKAVLQLIAKSGEPLPKAIIAVDLFGLPANYTAIRPIADQFRIPIIEDGAQGFGGRIGASKACSFGDVSTTSFFPAKPLGCYGDGGALFTDSDEHAELLKSLRIHGKSGSKYNNVRIGMNSRLDTIQAAILLEKLSIFDEELLAKSQLASQYCDYLEHTFETPSIPDEFVSSWAQYTIKVDDRESTISHLRELGIESQIYYETCIHQQQVFKGNPLPVALPVATELSRRVLSLPMNAYAVFEPEVWSSLVS